MDQELDQIEKSVVLVLGAKRLKVKGAFDESSTVELALMQLRNNCTDENFDVFKLSSKL